MAVSREMASKISILSLYAEGDIHQERFAKTDYLFQSSPSMQRETYEVRLFYSLKKFQSSPSMQRETPSGYIFVFVFLNFNPLPLCRGRLIIVNCVSVIISISILSLYAEGDYRFQTQKIRNIISILSLYAEGDFSL